MTPLAAQTALGVYLKLHIHERTLRPWAVLAHGIMSVCFLSVLSETLRLVIISEGNPFRCWAGVRCFLAP